MGGAVTIGLLMMASGEMLEGRWESAGARGSGCECLDDFPGPEVLALLGGMRRTDDSGGGEVDGLHVVYRRWGGLEGTPPLEDGTVEASGAWNVESWGKEALGRGLRDNEGSIWPPLMCAMFKMGRKVEVASSNAWLRGVEWRESWFISWWRVFAMGDGVCEMKTGFGGL